jgi:hypothetical protein
VLILSFFIMRLKSSFHCVHPSCRRLKKLLFMEQKNIHSRAESQVIFQKNCFCVNICLDIRAAFHKFIGAKKRLSAWKKCG